jgi:uroporphyrinogen-III synthase
MPSVLLTRPSERNRADDDLHSLLKHGGVELIELPMVHFTLARDLDILDQALQNLSTGNYDLAILSSPTAVEFFLQRITDLGLDVYTFLKAKFGAVGAATANALRAMGIEVSLPLPLLAGSQQLVDALRNEHLAGKRILLLQSQIGMEHLQLGLEELGATVNRVTLYETHGPTVADGARFIHLLESERKPDVVVFFSPSSVRFCIRTLAEMASGLIRELPAIACIGETTAKAVEEALKRRPEIVARKANQTSLAQDILIYLSLPKMRIIQ